MKTRHPIVVKFASLLSLAIGFSAGAVNAQTITQTYSNTGSTTGNLSSIGFDSYQYSQNTNSYDNVSSVVGAQGGSFIGTNWTAINYVFSNPATPAGYELTSVALSLYILDIAPAAATTSFQIYSGLDRTGGVIGSFNLTEPTSELNFASISIPLAALAGGFSIGYATNGAAQPAFTAYTESNADSSFHPSVSFTYSAVPEPTSALLAAIGSLGLLRRRRN